MSAVPTDALAEDVARTPSDFPTSLACTNDRLLSFFDFACLGVADGRSVVDCCI
jgi:hypothetical protein